MARTLLSSLGAPGLMAVAAAALITGSAQAADAPTLRTAVDPGFAPHAMAKLGGGIQGFNIDLGEALAKKMGRKVSIEGADFSGLIPALNAGKYDLLLAPVTVTPERAKALLFTEGYMDTDYSFLQPKSAAPIAALEDLKGKTLAVNKGSNYEKWARDNAEKYGFKFDVYGTNPDAIQAVLSGRADANLAGNTVVAWAAKQNPMLKTGYTIKTGLVWALAFRADDVAGRDAASMALKCLKQDGTLAKLGDKWFGIAKPAADSALVKIAPGHGVPDTPGYDAKPVALKC